MMIRFARKPDCVFSELIDCAISEIVENYLSSGSPRDQEDWLCAAMPRGARYFTAPQAKEQLLALRKIYHDDRLYQLTKYHWLLLYECLETFAHGFNEQPVGWLAKKYGLQQLDFRTLIHLYFWDTSFLEDHLARMSREESRTMLIWPESIGLTAGFKTHPDELAFTLCDADLANEFEAKEEAPVWSMGARTYPAAQAGNS
jgi:hypothetical protein